MIKNLSFLFFTFVASVAYAASYSVPVPTELADHNVWSPTQAVAQVQEKKLDVTYQLPAELVGTTCGPFHFTGTLSGSFADVTGDGVYGTCMQAGEDRLTCILKYPEMTIDEKSRDAAMEVKFAGAELLARKKVANFFRDDPAGILLIELPVKK